MEWNPNKERYSRYHVPYHPIYGFVIEAASRWEELVPSNWNRVRKDKTWQEAQQAGYTLVVCQLLPSFDPEPVDSGIWPKNIRG